MRPLADVAIGMRHHLHGLNTLRAIAALVVVTVHLEMEKSDRGIPSALDAARRWVPDHHLGVVLFFVLSGYLITFLLMKEREEQGRIDRRAFYLRRILRIWPVYYFVLLVSFLFFPFAEGADTVLLCVAGLPNIAKALDIGWPSSPQIWSIGVEEQFYLIWPWVLPWLVRGRRMVPWLIAFFVGWSLLPHVLDALTQNDPDSVRFRRFSHLFFYGAKFNSMAFGCLLGYMLATGHLWLKYLNNAVVGFASILAAFGLWFGAVYFPAFHDEIYSILFGLVILNVSGGRRFPIDLDRGPLDFLGRISYGIYMYHWLVLLVVMAALAYAPGMDMARYNALLYSGVLGGTILVSWLSYIGPERYFLRMKPRAAGA